VRVVVISAALPMDRRPHRATIVGIDDNCCPGQQYAKDGKGSGTRPPATFSSFDRSNKSGIMRQKPRRMG